MKVRGSESINACQYAQICAGLKEVIDGVIHGVKYIWGNNSFTKNWGFLLVDTKNAFNEINGIGILWKVHHLWPSGSHFVFNCCCHW